MVEHPEKVVPSYVHSSRHVHVGSVSRSGATGRPLALATRDMLRRSSGAPPMKNTAPFVAALRVVVVDMHTIRHGTGQQELRIRRRRRKEGEVSAFVLEPWDALGFENSCAVGAVRY